MNLLEHYIMVIHSVVEEASEWIKDRTYIRADLTVDCYGKTERVEKYFLNWEQWNTVKEQGYYMG